MVTLWRMDDDVRPRALEGRFMPLGYQLHQPGARDRNPAHRPQQIRQVAVLNSAGIQKVK